jgi:hypothetical protein
MVHSMHLALVLTIDTEQPFQLYRLTYTPHLDTHGSAAPTCSPKRQLAQSGPEAATYGAVNLPF